MYKEEKLNRSRERHRGSVVVCVWGGGGERKGEEGAERGNGAKSEIDRDIKYEKISQTRVKEGKAYVIKTR